MSIFSTYSQPENQITSTLLAVLKQLRMPVMQFIIQTLIEEPETDLIVFENQPQGNTSRPDARISSSFSYWFEVKRVTNAVNEKQIQAHIQLLNNTATSLQRLIVLTPDATEPAALVKYHHHGVVWSNFNTLYDVLVGLLDPQESPLRLTSTERYLLVEFTEFLEEAGLIHHSEPMVVIVPARVAWKDYHDYHAYICQPNRTFREASHMGFYLNKTIKNQIPKILNHLSNVELTPSPNSSASLNTLINAMQNQNDSRLGERHDIYFLSSPNDQDTLTLASDVVHHGKPFQNQRYFSLRSFRKPDLTDTSQL
ncbi:hypothetical protein [Sulfobacillus thermosulfidooxidans]|uniref:hypothetical protein n=1 Tax=Sulfobacillus thermosulfidooxidans TaxID=28034 RepID=UPI000AF11EE8|nr:hypothetical protein [Sulfobacillus thermosulfidooxidans]